jgi:hypothetical protein
MLQTFFYTLLLFIFITCAGTDKRKGCVTGDCNNGAGTFIDPEDGKYIGQFKDGDFNGKGSFSSPDGEKYNGNFKNGNFDGEGTLILADGEKYVGNLPMDFLKEMALLVLPMATNTTENSSRENFTAKVF